MKKLDKKAFTLIELLVVIAVVGILVVLGAPRFTGYTQKAELTRIQHDIKVMEQEVGTVLSTDYDDFNKWENNNKDFNQLIQENELFEKEGIADVEPIDGPYKIIPEKHKDKINTKLKGTFYANRGGKVYYEEEEPGYSDKEIDDLVKKYDFIPVATADELNNVRYERIETYGAGTQWEGEYLGGIDKHYVQVLDIDLSEYSEEGWNPIGTSSSSFKGTYDGGNYVIRELEIKGESYQGLFGRTLGATISNVRLIESKVTGTGNYVGGLVGMAYYSTISNSYAAGSVTGEYYVGGLVGEARTGTEISNSYATGSVKGGDYSGGLVGSAYDGTTISNSYAKGPVEGGQGVGGLVGRAYESSISKSYATGSVTGSGERVGGLVGAAWNSTIENSYATGSVEGTNYYAGGLVGRVAESTINNSYSTGSVTGENEVGGLVGYVGYDSTIEKSFATGSVKGTKFVGGLVGLTSTSTIENSYATGSVTGPGYYVAGLVGQAGTSTTINNSYATGSVKGTNHWVGGLVGLASSSAEISNSYWNTETTGKTSSAGGTGRPTEEMKKEATFLGWNFDNVWKIDEGNDYPKLR